MTTNAERQAAYKERMRKAGYQQVTLWIQPEIREHLINIASKLRQLEDERRKAVNQVFDNLELSN